MTIPKYNFIKKFISKNKKKMARSSIRTWDNLLIKKRGWHVISTEIYEPFAKFAKKIKGQSHKFIIRSVSRISSEMLLKSLV